MQYLVFLIPFHPLQATSYSFTQPFSQVTCGRYINTASSFTTSLIFCLLPLYSLLTQFSALLSTCLNHTSLISQFFFCSTDLTLVTSYFFHFSMSSSASSALFCLISTSILCQFFSHKTHPFPISCLNSHAKQTRPSIPGGIRLDPQTSPENQRCQKWVYMLLVYNINVVKSYYSFW